MNRRIKTILIWLVLLGCVVFAVVRSNTTKAPRMISAEEAIRLIDQGKVDSYRHGDQGLLLATGSSEVGVRYQQGTKLLERLHTAEIAEVSQPSRSDSNDWWLWGGAILVAAFAVYYFLRKFGGGGLNNVVELRKSKARPVQENDKARFSDIGGNQQAVEFFGDIIDFLRAPQRWASAGVRVPRGILIVGPPGTGKTLLARAVAGETQAAFFYTSAAEFVEMFVGVGASRVRDTFERAAAQQPAVVFIDEIDAVGRRRGSGVGTMHEEREQTLNQLLVLLDGMEKHQRLVVIGATNRPDILDPALLRSGRFDRTLRLDPPQHAERVEILKIHTRQKPLDASVSLEEIAADTEGFTGADLETLTNAAGLLALRRTRTGGNGQPAPLVLQPADFVQARQEMRQSNRQFDRLDAIMVESVSQFAEPTGPAVARVTLSSGEVIEGRVLWMNATHIKVRTSEQAEIIIAKDAAAQVAALAGTEAVPNGDLTPDRWAERGLDVRS